jgi:hypothetical protein
MSLIGVKILGVKINDKLLFKLLLGIIAVVSLIFLVGSDVFYDWVAKSLVVWIGAMFLFVSLAYVFIEEEITIKHIILLIIGVVIIFLYGYLQNISVNIVIASVIQSLIWMTIFSLLLEPFKNFIEK